jgi:hypothetical protein
MTRRASPSWRVLLAMAAAASLSLTARHSSSTTTVERQAAIVARALSYEQTLDERVGKQALGIAVLYLQGHDGSERCAREWTDGFSRIANVQIRDRDIALKLLAYSAEGVRKARASSIHVFVVCGGLNSELPEISRAARANRILTVGALLAYVEQSMTLGVFPEDGKYKIVVNLRAAADERVTFSSAMLRLARIIR